MGSTPFNTTFVQPVQLLGVDGQWPAAVDNPVPVEIASGSINITAVISGAVILGSSTASIGSATVFQGTNPWLVGNNTAALLNATIVGTTVISGSLPSGNNPLGKINYNATSAQLSSVLVNFSAIGTAVIVTGVATTTINVYRLLLNNSTATGLTFQNGTSPVTGPMSLGTNGSITLDLDGEPWFTATSGANFNISITVTSQISGRLYYTQV